MKLLSLSINGTTINNPGGIPTGGIFETQVILRSVVTYFVIAGIILALVYLVLGGISWITSGGDKQKLAQAKNRITFAIIGLLVVFLSFFILSFVYYFFRINNSSGGGGRRAEINNSTVSKLASNWVLTNKK